MSDLRAPSIAGAAARGIVAAMAMTGMRRVTVGLGLVQQAPPQEVAGRVGQLFEGIRPERRDEVIEVAHWAYGGLAGAAFGLLPRAARGRRWSGPVYGFAIWTAFERVVAPVLGLRKPSQRPLTERAMVVADHLLYGAVLSG